MKVAISPCPNDTFLFGGWIEGHVGKDFPIAATFADIQKLNEWAIANAYPLIKVSFGSFAKIAHMYQLLPTGSALGFNCGPKIIAKSEFSLADLPQKIVAIPGKETTAHLLFSRLFPQASQKIFCLYHEVAQLIENKKADCGLIIHESRFTFQKEGFIEIADLGEIWEKEKKAPLPLGGVAISRALPDEVKKRALFILQDSLKFAHSNSLKLLPFILHHAQEKERLIVDQHIATYVNQETISLSSRGIEAIQTLIDCPLPKDWLYF